MHFVPASCSFPLTASHFVRGTFAKRGTAARLSVVLSTCLCSLPLAPLGALSQKQALSHRAVWGLYS